MKIEKNEICYILQHESGNYFYISSMPVSQLYLTDEPLKATRYLLKSVAEQAIVNAKIFTDVRWQGEKIIKDILMHCTPKKISIKVEAEVEE